MTIRRLAKITLIALLATILLLSVAVALLVGTSTGSQLIFTQLEKRGLISYQQLSGSLASGLNIKKLTVNTPTAKATLQQLRGQVSLSRLIKSELHAELFATAVEVTLKPVEAADKLVNDEPDNTLLIKLREGKPLLPIAIHLNKLTINQLTIVQQRQDEPDRMQQFSGLQATGVIDDKGMQDVAVLFSHEIAGRKNTLTLLANVQSWRKLETMLNLDWSTEAKDGLTVHGNLALQGNRGQLDLTHESTGDIRSTLNAQVKDWLLKPDFALEAAIDSLDLAAKNSERNQAPTNLQNTQLSVVGTLDKAALTLNSLLLINDQRLPIAVNGQLDDQTLQLHQLQVITDAGIAVAEGSLAWKNKTISWQSVLKTQQFAANAFNPALPEVLNGQVSIEGSLDQTINNGALALSFSSDDINGTLRGLPYSAKLTGNLHEQMLTLQRADLSVGNNTFSATGKTFIADTYNPEKNPVELQFSISAPQLNTLIVSADGKLVANGQLKGTLDKPDLHVTAQMENVRHKAIRINSGSLILALDEGKFDSEANRLLLNNARYNEFTVDQLAINLSGSLYQPSVALDAKTQLGHLTVASHSEVTAKAISGKITTVQFVDTSSQSWQLAQPTAYQYESETPQTKQWALKPLCLHNDKRRTCIEGYGSDTEQTIAASADQLSLAWLRPALGLPVQIDGSIDVNTRLHLDSQKGSTRINGHFQLNKATQKPIVVSNANNHTGSTEAISVQIERLGTRIDIRDNQANGTLSFAEKQGGAINGTVKLNDITDNNSPLDATLSLGIPDVSPYTSLLSVVEVPGGHLDGTLTVSQTLKGPAISTQWDMTIPALHVYPLNVDWRNVSITMKSDNQSQLMVDASMQAGDGQLTANGTVSDYLSANWQSTLRVNGDSALLANKDNQRLIATPDLTVAASKEIMQITGTLLVPDARFEFKTKPGRVSLTKDAVVHRAKSEQLDPSKKQSGPNLVMDILIKLSDKVEFLAYGLKTNIDGELSIKKNEQENLLGQGELQLVGGTYKAYGQDLKIERGIVQFAGDLSQPTVDLKAFRQAGSVKAGVEVSGPVNNLRSSLYSEPALVDAEILSYLIRGKALNETSGADQDYLSNAALSYAVSQSTPVSEKFSDWFGFDEAGITADEGIESLGFSLGKYLTPKLYVRYGYGIVDKVNKLFTQYQLTNKLFLESEVGEGQSVDLLYKN